MSFLPHRDACVFWGTTLFFALTLLF